MKYCFGILIFFGMLYASRAEAQQPNWLWARGGGGTGNDQSSSVATDAKGNVFVTGYYTDSAIFSGIDLLKTKGSHLFLAKYSNDGILLWIKTTGPLSGQSQGTSLTIGADNYLYLTGYFSDSAIFDNTIVYSSGGNDLFLAKYDLDGKVKWVVNGGGPGSDLGKAISSDLSTDILVTGRFSGVAHFGGKVLTSAGGDDIFLIKYDSGGSVVWAESFGSKVDDAGFGITAGHSGSIAVTGTFSDTASFGNTKLIAGGASDIFIAKFSPGGNLLWARQAGDTSYGEGSSIVMDNDENVYVTGRFYGTGLVPGCDGTGNIYIAKYNSAGVRQWMKCAGNGGEESADGIAIDSSGSLFITGGFDFMLDFGSGEIPNYGVIDAFILKYNSSGVAQWADHAGGGGNDYGTSVALDRSGNLFLAGAFSDTSSFGPFELQSRHLRDAFITKIGTRSGVGSSSGSSRSQLSVFPNPAHSNVMVAFDPLPDEHYFTIEIINPLGITVKKTVYTNLAEKQSSVSLPVGDLPCGIYFCRLVTTLGSRRAAIVID